MRFGNDRPNGSVCRREERESFIRCFKPLIDFFKLGSLAFEPRRILL